MIRAQPQSDRFRWKSSLFVLVLISLMAPSSRGDLVNFTGNVGNDFPASDGTTIVPGKPGSVAQASYITQNGWTTGFLVQSLRFSYDQKSDTLFVGVQTSSITGDAEGSGIPGYTSPQMAAAGGINFAHFGGDKSLTLAFASATTAGGRGATNFVAGIPADKSKADTRNTNGFTVATSNDTGRGLAYSYGTILDNHVGKLAVDPDAAHPNFEFSLTHFSQFTGFNPSKGYYVSLFLGSQRAVVVGKEALDWIKVPGINPAPGGVVNGGGPVKPPAPGPAVPAPEPASMVLFGIGAVVLAGSAWRRRSA